MKKVIFLVAVAALPYFCGAQNKKTSDSPWNIELGPAVAHPIHYLNMFSTVGMGLDGAVTRTIVNGLAAGVRVNYLYFLGRSADPFFTGGGSHYKHSNVYDALAEANYHFDNKIVLGVNLGLGVLSFNGHSDPVFAQKFYAGYQWDRADHPIIFAAFYEQTDYHKNAGVRATIRLN